MKIYLPYRLRLALITAIFSISSYNASSAYAASMVEAEEELAIPTLTELNTSAPALYTNESAYQLKKVTDLNPAKEGSIVKYLFNTATGTYTPVQYNVVFEKPLGEAKPDSEAYSYYEWYRESSTNHWTIRETSNQNNASIFSYAESDSRLNHSTGAINVDNNFLGLRYNLNEKTSYGGALRNSASIGTLTGHFIGNYTSSMGSAFTDGGLDQTSSETHGGAISNEKTITTITGDFIGNIAYSEATAYALSGGTANASAFTRGGAIYNIDTITSITGDFISNASYSYTNTNTDESSSASDSSGARGGAIYNEKAIANITSDFIGNFASAFATSTSKANARGGAIYNEGSMGFLAVDSSLQFSGNYITTDRGTTKRYEAIYNLGSQNDEATLNFNAYDNKSIVINDGINGYELYTHNQVININNGFDGANKQIAADGKAFSTVAFNSFVSNQSILVHAGELHLGKFAGIGRESEAGYVPSTQANLNNSSITIKAGALVSVQGQLLLDATSYISTSAEGGDNGVSTIIGLAADSSISGGRISVADNSSLSMQNITLTKIAITTGANANLMLKNITLGYDNVVSNSIMSLMRAAAPLNYTLQGVDIGAAAVTGSLTLDVNMTEDELGLFNTTLAAGGDISFTVEGLEDALLVAGLMINLDINGDSYQATTTGVTAAGVQFSIIPEPSTATLSLLALAGLLARRRRKVA